MKKKIELMRAKKIIRLAYLNRKNDKIVWIKFTAPTFIKVVVISKQGIVREMLFKSDSYGLRKYEDSALLF